MAQQERSQATHKMEHSLANKYMSQEGYIKEKSVANPLKWTSHPLAKDTVLQQISSSPSAEGCCVPRSKSPMPPWAGFGSKEALDEFIEEYIDKCASYYDEDKICKDCEIVRESRGYDSEATLKQRLEQNYQNNEETERQDRETLLDLMLEKDGMYIGHIQVHIYKDASEEEASTT